MLQHWKISIAERWREHLMDEGMLEDYWKDS